MELAALLTGYQEKEQIKQTEFKAPAPGTFEAARDVQMPVAPPPALVEMMDMQVQLGESGGPFEGRETWDVPFQASGQVRIGKMVLNARG